jgi:hypothetical protein
MCHSQILVPHLHLVNPQAKAHTLPDDFLRAVPEITRAHRSRRHFDPFLPEQPRLIAIPQAGAAGEKIVRFTNRQPTRLIQLLLPYLQSLFGFVNGPN